MAARRRSFEEKNLKTLRELAALPPNKQCFDCHQRGPTYINMTIGSFVCTSCSGILRGLTPPHRVKSITMTTFTPEEIEFLKSRGNEYCRYVWLGTYDSRTSNMDNDGKDEYRKRDMMVQKYEKKRWYVDPEIALKKMQHDQQFQQRQATQNSAVTTNSSRQYSKVPEVQPLSQLLGKSPTPLIVKNNQANEKWPNPVSSASAHPVTTTRNTSQTQGSFDLLAELGGGTVTSPSSTSQGTWTLNENFANFEKAFSDTKQPPASSGITSMLASISLDAYPMAAKENTVSSPQATAAPLTATGMPSSSSATMSKQAREDRYAALADLDSCFNHPSSVVTSPSWSVKSVTTVTGAASTPSAASGFGFSSADSSMTNLFTTAPSNPFATTATSLWGSHTPSLPLQNSVNPFQSSAETCLPYQQQINTVYAPLPVVGNSPSDDSARAHYTAAGTVPLTVLHSGQVSSPPNGFHGQLFGVQNGDLVTSPTSRTTSWGIPSSTSMPFSASQLPHSTSAHLEKQPAEHMQYSEWVSNTANPFVVGSSNIGVSSAQKPSGSSSNPFL